jgi:hypothetical protein
LPGRPMQVLAFSYYGTVVKGQTLRKKSAAIQ